MNNQDPTYKALAVSIQKGFVNTARQPLINFDNAVKAQAMKDAAYKSPATTQKRGK